MLILKLVGLGLTKQEIEKDQDSDWDRLWLEIIWINKYVDCEDKASVNIFFQIKELWHMFLLITSSIVELCIYKI